MDGEFTTSTASPLGAASHFGADDDDLFYDPNLDLDSYEQIFNLGAEVWQFASDVFYLESVGGLRESGTVGFIAALNFNQEGSARHSPALHAVLSTSQQLAPGNDLAQLFEKGDYLKFALFHTPGLAGTPIEQKVGEGSPFILNDSDNPDGDIDPGQSLGGNLGVEPIYRLLHTSPVSYTHLTLPTIYSV